MTRQRRDISHDLEAAKTDAGYDLKAVESDALVKERILRGLLTEPGELIHRPDWGAGLLQHQGETPTTTRIQRIIQQAERFLATLDFLEDYSVRVTETDDGLFRISTAVEIDGRELRLPDTDI